jgi:dolichol-phosphate mannosyltransferase
MYELSVVIPTFNERDNIIPLVNALTSALHGVHWEAVFVDDDSRDGTLDILQDLASQHTNIRYIHRLNQRGLASACIEGMLSSVAPYIAVIDADLQHDEKILPDMLKAVKSEQYDLAVGSRHVRGGSMGSMPKLRVKISHFASKLSHFFLRHQVTDPMSGFFMLRRELIQSIARNLSASGYKLLLDIIVTAKDIKIKEVPYDMRHRQAGESKLDTLVILEYLQFLLEKTIGRFIPVRFILFVLVGAIGVLVHLSSLGVLYRVIEASFITSQSIATFIAMTSNFFLNNIITHRDQRIRGVMLIWGLIKFCLACSFGALINLMIADYMKDHFAWWFAGMGGALVGSIWNYGMTSVFTWKRK